MHARHNLDTQETVTTKPKDFAPPTLITGNDKEQIYNFSSQSGINSHEGDGPNQGTKIVS